MWLVLPPTTSSQSVQASEGLTSLSQSQSETLAQSVTSRGKPKPQQSWQRAWKTARYIKRLSGLTCPPSTVNLGVEQWIASLVATRASQTPSPDHVLGPMMTASSSTNLFGSRTKCGLTVSFAKTSQGTRTDSSQPLSQLSKGWATALRQEYSQRAKWGLPTDESGCSSWQTPAASEPGWKNIEVVDKDGNPPENWNQRFYDKKTGRLVQKGLTQQSERWQTPKVASGGWEKQKDGSRKLTLQGESENWPTIQARDWKGKSGRSLKGEETDLPTKAETWPTPTVRDHKGSSPDSIIRNDGKSRMSQLDTKAEQGFHTSHQDQTTQDGQKLSKNTPRLNPLFVQWMQGWPIGWTNYAQPVTGFAQWLEQSRGYLYRLISNRN